MWHLLSWRPPGSAVLSHPTFLISKPQNIRYEETRRGKKRERNWDTWYPSRLTTRQDVVVVVVGECGGKGRGGGARETKTSWQQQGTCPRRPWPTWRGQLTTQLFAKCWQERDGNASARTHAHEKVGGHTWTCTRWKNNTYTMLKQAGCNNEITKKIYIYMNQFYLFECLHSVHFTRRTNPTTSNMVIVQLSITFRHSAITSSHQHVKSTNYLSWSASSPTYSFHYANRRKQADQLAKKKQHSTLLWTEIRTPNAKFCEASWKQIVTLFEGKSLLTKF